MRVLRTGIPAAGIAAGTAFVLERRVSAAPSAATGDPAAETARFHAALAQAKTELGILAAENDIFAAHLEMADDPMLAEQVEERISEHGFSAERALDEACEEVCGMLATLDDEYLGGRTDDVRDVCGRIRRILTGETAENPFAGLAPGTIVVAEELTPSDTALMDFSRIAGVVTAHGSVTSHVCIIARAKGIAAIVGASECMLEIKTGDKLIINGETGEIIVAPDTATERRYRALSASRKRHGEHCLKGAHMTRPTAASSATRPCAPARWRRCARPSMREPKESGCSAANFSTCRAAADFPASRRSSKPTGMRQSCAANGR